MAIVALKAAAACGWKIVDIFVSPADRQVYGPVLNDVIHFIPTLAVWKWSASELVSLSLTNDYVVNVLADVLHQVTSFKVYPAKLSEWDVFTKTLVVNIKQFIKNLETVKADTQRTLSLLRVLRYFWSCASSAPKTWSGLCASGRSRISGMPLFLFSRSVDAAT